MSDENARLRADLENCRIALRVKYEEVAKFKAEVAALRKSDAIVKSEVLPLVEGLVALVEGDLRSAGERKQKELTRYVQPLRAIQHILHKRLDY
jgi:hypothetical protein